MFFARFFGICTVFAFCFGTSVVMAADTTVTSKQYVDNQLANKQPASNAAYQMGAANGTWQTMSAAQQNALNSGVTTSTVSQVATNTTDIAGKQPASNAAYQMGAANGTWQTMSAAQQNALNSGVTTSTVSQVATNTANIAGKQPASTAAAIGGANGTWTNLSELQQNALNAMIPAGSPTAPTGYAKIWVQ